MTGKTYQFDNPRDVEQLQQTLLEPHVENDKVACENESDLDDYVEVNSGDSDTKHISSEEDKGELDVSGKYVFWKG